jgi:glycosyltransferase involved in cell wall biosynthesis
MTLHNVKPHEKSFFKIWLNNSIIKLADEYIVHNEDNKKVFQENFKTKKRVNVIPLGLDIKSTISKKIARKKLNLPINKKILLFFGNIRDYKGLDVLIRSLEKINNIVLLIAGQCWDKKLLERIKTDKNIVYSGGFIQNKQIPLYFSASNLVVYPYKYFDASSAAGAEALAYGRPLVVTSVGGLPELVKDKRVIAKPNDSKDLRDKIIYALNNLNRLAKDSSEKAKQFSWNNIAQKTMEVYNENIN